MSAPLVVNTTDGTVWRLRPQTRDGEALYAIEGAPANCPSCVLATFAELEAHGIAGTADALSMPVGPGPLRLTAVQGMALAELIGDVKPASPKLLHAFGESVRDCREHKHPESSEDFHCLNLTAWMGERAALVLRSLLDAEAENARLRSAAAEVGGLLDANHELGTKLAGAELAADAMRPGWEAAPGLRKRVAELEAEQQIVYRVVDCAKTVALYTCPGEARKHCESMARAEHGGGSEQQLFWRLDEDTADQPHGPEWLIESTAPGYSRMTGFSIDPVVLAKKFAESGGV